MERCTDGHYCLNGGKCDVDNTTPDSCLCPNGYAGSFCEKRVTRCAGGNYCENGAVCSGSRCVCPAGFDGGHCQLLVGHSPPPAPPASKGRGALADGDKRLAAIIAVPLVFVVVGLSVFITYLVRRERKGDPLFSKLEEMQSGGGGKPPASVEVA